MGNDEKFEQLRQFAQGFHKENQNKLRSADKLSRRGKFIWCPYLSLEQKHQQKKASRGMHDLLNDRKINKIPDDILLAPDSPMRKTILAISAMKNKPSK